MNHEAAVADAQIDLDMRTAKDRTAEAGSGGEHFPGDLLACSSAEGGREQQQPPPAGGHLRGHCNGGECLEHSGPLQRMRAMEERTCLGTCLPTPAPGKAASREQQQLADGHLHGRGGGGEYLDGFRAYFCCAVGCPMNVIGRRYVPLL
jgi:hypothetical protein